MRGVPQDLIPIVTSTFLRLLVNPSGILKERALDLKLNLLEFRSFVFHNLKIF